MLGSTSGSCSVGVYYIQQLRAACWLLSACCLGKHEGEEVPRGHEDLVDLKRDECSSIYCCDMLCWGGSAKEGNRVTKAGPDQEDKYSTSDVSIDSSKPHLVPQSSCHPSVCVVLCSMVALMVVDTYLLLLELETRPQCTRI